MTKVDYDAPAGLYGGGRPRPGARHSGRLTFRRFDTLAEAVQYAVEEQPGSLGYISIEVDEAQFRGDEILRLYQSDDFPLERRQGKRK